MIEGVDIVSNDFIKEFREVETLLAMQWLGDNRDQLSILTEGRSDSWDFDKLTCAITIPTGLDVMVTDWIVKGKLGGYYPIDDEVIKKSYVEVKKV